MGDPTSSGAALSGGGAVTVASGATLGGYGSVTGSVQNNGTVAVANATPGFASGATGNLTVNGTFTNAALLQLAGPGVGNTLTVAGNYVGQQATASLRTQLGTDNSPTDKIIINGGTATGSTTLKIANAGGKGGQTTGDGIQVVQTVNGASTAGSAFTGGTANAGAYTYYLYRGGITPGTQDNWYLRSTTLDPTRPPIDPIVPVPPVDPETPLYRTEVPVYSQISALAREIAVQQIGTFHDRMGGQDLLDENGKWGGGWGRVWGDHMSQDHTGTVNQSFSGTIFGLQVGQDVYSNTTDSGYRDHAGLFFGFARGSGDVKGFALATQDLAAGSLAINSYSLGAYWTRIAPSGWYVDTVLMGSTMSVNPSSLQGNTATTRANAFTASLEGGVPLPLPYGLSLEPQAQLIYQYTHINDLTDPAATVSFKSANELIGRLGLRLQTQFQANGINWKPYLRLDVLRYFGGTDTVNFSDSTKIDSSVGSTQGHVGAGVYAKLNQRVSLYLTGGYWFNLGGSHRSTAEGNAGVRLSW